MGYGSDRVGRNDPCPCGSGSKAKHCCGLDQRHKLQGGRLAEVAASRGPALEELCDDCLTELWLEVLDLPDHHDDCRLRLGPTRSASVTALAGGLADGDADAMVDELPGALREVDCPAARAELGQAVLDLEAAGRVPTLVASVALGDLGGSGPSLLLMAALLSALAMEVDRCPIPVGSLLGRRMPRPSRSQAGASRCRRKSRVSG